MLASGVPVLYDPLRCQVEHPAQGIVAGEAGLVFGDLPELAIQSLDNVRRVYDFPHLRRVFKKRTQNVPVFFPAFHAGRVLLLPRFSELDQRVFCFFQSDSGVDFL